MLIHRGGDGNIKEIHVGGDCAFMRLGTSCKVDSDFDQVV